MSLIKKIGLDEFLQSKGLTEAQVEVIYKGEIKKLEAQEKEILKMIDEATAKMKAINLERHNHALAMDTERVELDAKVKTINEMRKEMEDSKRVIEIGKRDISLLQEKLNEAKEVFRQERVVYAERTRKLEADEISFSERARELSEKEKAFEKLSDDVYLQKKNLEDQLKESRELTEKLSLEEIQASGRKAFLDAEKEFLQKLENDLHLKNETLGRTITDQKEKLNADREQFEAEHQANEEALRVKELSLLKREKIIEEYEADIKRQSENKIIQEGRKKVK